MSDRRPMDGGTIEGALFSRYAEADLDRWRALTRGEVVHVDPRWGTGRVEDVRWGTCCDHVAPYIQVRVRYADYGIVVFRASSGPATKKSGAGRGGARGDPRTTHPRAARCERSAEPQTVRSVEEARRQS